MAHVRRVEGIVINSSSKINAYFVRASSIPRLVLLDFQFCPEGDLFGKWVRMAVDGRDRACEAVEIIEDVFKTRKRDLPEVLIDMKHSYRHNSQIEVFRNDYFGLIGDPDRIIRQVEGGATYTLWIRPVRNETLGTVWQVSHSQDSFPPKDSRFENGSLLKLRGIVTSHAPGGYSYFAWSNQKRDSTIRLKYELCFGDEDLLGKWIEMEIDEKNVVQKPVSVLRDLFHTETNRGNVEIQVEFQHTNRFDNQFEMFHHDYFGTICDSKRLMSYVEPGAWYFGWIEYFRSEEKKSSRWRLAVKPSSRGPSFQNNEEPIFRSSSPFERYQGDEPRCRSPDARGDRGRHVSPDSREYCSLPRSNYPERRRTPSPDRNYYRSPSPPPRRRDRSMSPDLRPPVRIPSSQYLGSDSSSFVSNNEGTNTSTHEFGRKKLDDVYSLTNQIGNVSVKEKTANYKPWNPHECARKKREMLKALSSGAESTCGRLSVAESGRTSNPIQEPPSDEQLVRQFRTKIQTFQTLLSRFIENDELRNLIKSTDPEMYRELIDIFQRKMCNS